MAEEPATKKAKTATEQPPDRPATQKDIDLWLSRRCQPASFQSWLAASTELTAAYAHDTMLDAVKGRGRFLDWDVDPPDFGDFHYTEVHGPEDIMDGCIEEDDCDYDGFLPREVAVRRVWHERLDDAKSSFKELTHSRNSTLTRKRAMGLLREWLGREPEEPEVEDQKPPANASEQHVSGLRLEAQKLAMSLFPTILKYMEEYESGSEDKEEAHGARVAALRGFVEVSTASSLPDSGNDASFRQMILDEIFVFLIVYDLFTDFRVHTMEPREPSNLSLPVWLKESDECWWTNVGQWEVEGSVPWKGRGLLAKTGLLGHALVHSITISNTGNPMYPSNSYGYVELLQDVVNNMNGHPLGPSAALNSLEALLGFVEFDDNIFESQIYDLEEILSSLEGLVPEYPSVDSERADTLEELLTRARDPPQFHSCWERMSQVASKPLDIRTDVSECLQQCLQRLKKWFERRRGCGPCRTVFRMRLSGNHSKESLVKFALNFPAVRMLDLQDCTNLDEEILDAMTTYCKDAQFILLGGTSIPESCDVVSNLRELGCVVDFSRNCCRFCGRQQLGR